MSNQSCLLADDDPAPYRYDDDGGDALTVAGCAYQVPVFWLFCFDPGDLSVVPSVPDEGSGESQPIPTLTAAMARVHARLAERERLALRLFGPHADVWREWRAGVESVGRAFLKAEMCEIWCLIDDPDGLRRQLASALEWIHRGNGTALDDVLGLAGIEGYDRMTGRLHFDPERECAERFLFGWLELED